MKPGRTTSAADREALSAYLDSALSPGDSRALEARLRSEVDLRRELEELRAVRLAMRALPQIESRRDFRLSARSLAGARPAHRRYPALSLATAFAMLVCAVVYGFDAVRLGSLGAAAPLPAAQEPEILALEAPATSEAAREAAAEDSIAPTVTFTGDYAPPAAGLTALPTGTPAIESFGSTVLQTTPEEDGQALRLTVGEESEVKAVPDLVSILKVVLPVLVLVLIVLTVGLRRVS